MEVSRSRCILIIPEGDTNVPPRPFQLTVGGCVTWTILAAASLNLSLQLSTRVVTGQLPLAIAQLLIKCIPALRPTSNNDATAMTPVLHPYTTTSLCPRGINRIPSSFSGIYHDVPPVPSRSWLSYSRLTRSCSSASWKSSAREPRWAAPHGSVSSLRVGFQGVRSGRSVMAREGGGGKATRGWRSRPSRCRKTDLGVTR